MKIDRALVRRMILAFGENEETVARLRLLNQDKKRCSKCRAVKGLDDFPVHKDRIDGRGGVCIDCKYGAERKARQAKLEKQIDAILDKVNPAEKTKAEAQSGSEYPATKQCAHCKAVFPNTSKYWNIHNLGADAKECLKCATAKR